MSAKRILTLIFLSLFTMTCFATLPEYFSSRQWIEQHTPRDTTPTEQRIFVADSNATTNTLILRHHNGILLREVINSTHYKGMDVFVIVLRRQHKKDPVFFNTVKRTENPKFKLEALDVIWISTLPMAIN
jgi:hypothetical protein